MMDEWRSVPPSEPFVYFYGSFAFWKLCQDLMMLITGLDPVYGLWN